MAPFCSICSYRQATGRPCPIFHLHSSSREVRIVQWVEYSSRNLSYFCPTCVTNHSSWPPAGLNVCLSDSQLHNFHFPRDPTIKCPPDPVHVDWVTVSGGTISDLTHAFYVDYKDQPRPMRVFVSVGLNDMMRGADVTTMIEKYITLKEMVEAQNSKHPQTKNEMVIATLINPPKLVWFEGNGPPPANFVNHLAMVKELNSWIKFYNEEMGRVCTPSFHRFGVRTARRKLADGKVASVQSHQFSQWRQTEPTHDMVHLSDQQRIRMGKAVIRHFTGEFARFGPLE